MYTLITWIAGYSIVCLFGWIVTHILVIRGYKNKYKEDCDELVFVTFFVWALILILPFWRTIDQKHYQDIKEKVWLVDYKDKRPYKDLKAIEQCVTKGYDNEFDSLDNTKYYYDYLNIEISYKEISFSQLLDNLQTKDINGIYKTNIQLHKATVIQSLNGILKTNIDNGSVYYTIDGYTLGKDEKGQISSLANNQPIKLNIVYNNEAYKGDKNITDYKIIKAETEDNNIK